MSGPEDHFLARWSRRKREVGEAETPHDPLSGRAGEAEESQPQGPLPSEIPDHPPHAGAESAEPAEPLPSLEDLTAESDLSAFLRRGVPEALKKAALRRMWSLDPAIRDHVGLAEYAFDFNDPASIPGFGSVAADTPMARLAASAMSGQAKTGEAAGDAAPLTRLPARGVATPPPDRTSAAAAGDRTPASDEGRAAAIPAVTPTRVDAPPERPGEAGAAEARELRRGAETDPEGPRAGDDKPVPRHGGAMPR